MCQVHTGAYVSLLAPGKTDHTACHPRKTTTYILHAVPITTHTHDRRESTGKKKQIIEKKIKERIDKKAKNEKQKKIKKRQEKQEKTRQEEEARKGKKKNVNPADHRN